jgi:hypothetical protein
MISKASFVRTIIACCVMAGIAGVIGACLIGNSPRTTHPPASSFGTSHSVAASTTDFVWPPVPLGPSSDNSN